MSDATTKGIRTQVLNIHRTMASSDEAANSMETPWSDKVVGLHFLSKPKLNARTQFESDGKPLGMVISLLMKESIDIPLLEARRASRGHRASPHPTHS